MTVTRADWAFRSPFRIAYRERTHAQTVVVELQDGGLIGRGEALGVSYRGESVDTILAQLADCNIELRNELSRLELQTVLPPGGARNAIDCALWDLEAKRFNRRVWDLIGLSEARPLLTSFTLGVDNPAAMAHAAAAADRYPVLKLKLDGTCDVERVAQVRLARPDAEIIVDANQSWNEEQVLSFAPAIAGLGVNLVEQPLPAGHDEALTQLKIPLQLCADESFQTHDSLPLVAGKYQHVNVKLDKTGGLTAALDLIRLARQQGFGVMVGCMGGSSLSMAPAFIAGQLADRIDLDGPLLATSDRPFAILYQGGWMSPPDSRLWG